MHFSSETELSLCKLKNVVSAMRFTLQKRPFTTPHQIYASVASISSLYALCIRNFRWRETEKKKNIRPISNTDKRAANMKEAPKQASLNIRKVSVATKSSLSWWGWAQIIPSINTKCRLVPCWNCIWISVHRFRNAHLVIPLLVERCFRSELA